MLFTVEKYPAEYSPVVLQATPARKRVRFALVLAARAALAVAVTVACSVDQPLPPANNPASIKLGCVQNDQCTDGLVCHPGIGGGTCVAACTADATCAGIQAGLVCHPQLNGGACAPDCSVAVQGQVGDAICTTYGANIGCQSGRCVALAAPTTAQIRVFNALTELGTIAVSVDDSTEPLVAAVAVGSLEPQVATNVLSGTHVFKVADTEPAGPIAEFSRDLIAGHRYLLVVHELVVGTPAAAWIDEDEVALPPSGSVALAAANLAPGLPSQDFRFDPTAGEVSTVAGAIDFRTVRQVRAPAVEGTLLIGRALENRATMFAQTTFVNGGRYVALIWGGRALGFVETVVLSTTGIIARLPTAGVRIANATADLSQVLLSLDDETASTAAAPGPQNLGPVAGGVVLVPPGEHRVRLWRDVVGGVAFFDQTVTLTGRESYTFAAYGTLADGAKPLAGVFFDNAPGVTLSPTQSSLRVLHAVSAQQATATDVSQTIGANPSVPLSLGLAYGSVSAPVAIESAEAFTLGFAFASGAPSLLTSASLSITPGENLLAVASGDAATFAVWVIGRRATVNVNPQ